ncbi:MAG: class B sortase [Oscillospiraceae bacterium]|nr:class B sortase [Oscillospiraceae bacterium]
MTVFTVLLLVLALAAAGTPKPQDGESALPVLEARQVAINLAYDPPEKLTSLQGVNPEAVAWLSAPLLGLDEPLMQAGDNEKYLETGPEGERSRDGSLFLDFECESDFSGRHLIIYGHSFRNGGKFAPLSSLANEDGFRNFSRDITIYTPERAIPLLIVGLDTAPAESSRRRTVFFSSEDFLSYAEGLLASCDLVRESGEYKRLYSFITCNYEDEDFRLYVYAVEA